MQNLKRLGTAVALTLVLSLSTFAGDTGGPPCAPDAGIIVMPPCSAAPGQLDSPPASADQGIIETPPASDYLGFAITLFDNAVFF